MRRIVLVVAACALACGNAPLGPTSGTDASIEASPSDAGTTASDGSARATDGGSDSSDGSPRPDGGSDSSDGRPSDAAPSSSDGAGAGVGLDSSDGSPDASERSSGSPDASEGSSGSPDASEGSSGSPDASEGSDGGDASLSYRDAAAVPTLCPEADDPDSGALDIWVDALGAHTLADRGLILGCVHQASYTQAQVASNSNFILPSPPTNGYELYIIQYVSEGPPGIPKSVTALLYLPSGGAGDVPIAAVDHPTSGMGPSCGPTHTPAITDNVAVPLVGTGYAVVATDYGGMGVDNGMTSYLVGASEAAATLDGLRALLQLHETRFDASQLSTSFFVVGHSQGGHAALFTHALFDPSIGVSLLGSVSFAPGLGNAKDWSDYFNDPSEAVGPFDEFTTMSLYSHMLYSGGPDAGTWLTAAAQTSLPSIFHEECSTVGSSLMSVFPTQGDIFTASFTTGAAGCAFSAPCAGFEPWSTELIAEEPGNFASEAPALILQGTADTLVLPAETVCILNRLTAHGTPVQGCSYAGLDHIGIVAGALPDAVAWMAARRAGVAPAACTASIAGTCTLPD